MAESTAIVAEEPLILTKASIADGLSLIDRVLDEQSGMPSFAYTKLTLASRGATDLDIGSEALKFVRYVGVIGTVALYTAHAHSRCANAVCCSGTWM